ncbi:claret [Anaeramoeba flamelloides]|uniref:Claret n=1 Tax=Anaeramoeba flamelloides TaxID=1746091 RepID=A0ABQ8Y6M7_9EUKA|nr:claret [Anaeramoeba flamelloides]
MIPHSWGYNVGELGNGRSSHTGKPEPLTKSLHNLKQVGIGHQFSLFLTTDNKLFGYTKDHKPLNEITLPNNEIPESITVGTYHAFVITQSGKIFGMGSNSHGELGTGNKSTKQFHFFKFFELQDLLQIKASYHASYFLLKNGKLYSCGGNTNKQLGTENRSDSSKPIFVVGNVKNLYCGVSSWSVFYTTNENEVFCFGYNSVSQLGFKGSGVPPKKHENLDASLIKKFVPAVQHSIYITHSKKIFTCGEGKWNGTGVQQDSFVPLSFFDNIPVEDCSVGCQHTVVLSTEKNFYTFGYNSHGESGFGDNGESKTPRLLDISGITKGCPFQIYTGCNSTVIYKSVSTFSQDFIDLYESGEFTDCKIGNRPLHKIFVERRVDKPFEEIKNAIEGNFSQEEIKVFCHWIYSGQINSFDLFERICNHLQLPNLGDKKFEDDLIKMEKDEDSKDFTLIVQDDEDDEEEEEISVHKFILQAKSGLFRTMFRDVKEETQSVKDYSGKTIESIELLIKFFYTNKIELTADDDPILIVEELEDSITYYQLNEYSNLSSELNKIKSLNQKK